MIMKFLFELFSVRCHALADDKRVNPATVNNNMAAANVLEGLVGTTKFKNMEGTKEFPYNDTVCGEKKIVQVFGREVPAGDADYGALPVGSEYDQHVITSKAVTGSAKWLKTGAGASGWNKVVVTNDAPAPVNYGLLAATDAATTLTAAQVLGGMVTMTPTAARNLTLPTAALLVAAIPNAVVGSTVEILVVNNAAATHNITVVKGVGITDGSHADLLVVAAKTTARFRIRITNVGTPAALIYRA